ncbi:MAG: hypothetical protein QXP36_14630 [Conexivisphaerales archaeon]
MGFYYRVEVGMPWQAENGYEPPNFISDYRIDELIKNIILHGAFPDYDGERAGIYNAFVGYYLMRIYEYEKDDRFYFFWMREYNWPTERAIDVPDKYFYIYHECNFILPKEHCPLIVGENYHKNSRMAITIPQFRKIRDVIHKLSWYTEFYAVNFSVFCDEDADLEKCFKLDPKKERCYKIYKRKGLDCLHDYLLKHFTESPFLK